MQAYPRGSSLVLLTYFADGYCEDVVECRRGCSVEEDVGIKGPGPGNNRVYFAYQAYLSYLRYLTLFGRKGIQPNPR